MESQTEVAHIFRVYGPSYRKGRHRMHKRYHRTMKAIEMCRTARLGGHIDECDECGEIRISYNSCRNRHCPKCQCLDKERWLEKRKEDILPVPYYHVVFTIPEALRPLALRNKAVIYGILFKAVSGAIKQLSKDPKHIGAEIGFIAILHTWSQTLMDHPHIHCIVTGGGLSQDGKRWIKCKKNFFIHTKVLSRVFRGKFLDYLRKAYDSERLIFPGEVEELKSGNIFQGLLSDLYNMEWVVFCKEPLKSPEHVVEYLGRYTHRVAISNDRIIKFEDDKVTFRYRDSKGKNTIKFMTIDALEFIRRFLFHVLPENFMKIRHYGILSNRNRKEKLLLCKKLLGGKEITKRIEETWEELLFRLTGLDLKCCPKCGKGKMILMERLNPERENRPP